MQSKNERQTRQKKTATKNPKLKSSLSKTFLRWRLQAIRQKCLPRPYAVKFRRTVMIETEMGYWTRRVISKRLLVN